MKSKAIFVALLALAFTARAARVSQSEAAGAASVWAGAGKALGVRLGATVKSVREYSVTNGCSFYAVKLDGGTVIMTSDTALDPVVAFSARGDLAVKAFMSSHLPTTSPVIAADHLPSWSVATSLQPLASSLIQVLSRKSISLRLVTQTFLVSKNGRNPFSSSHLWLAASVSSGLVL